MVSRRTTRKIKGGKSPTPMSVSIIRRKLESIRGQTCSNLSVRNATLPAAIKAAKIAIKYAELHTNDAKRDIAEEDKVIKEQIADYWAEKCQHRMNWRNESRETPDYSRKHRYGSRTRSRSR